MKKLLSIILAVAMLAVFIPVASASDESEALNDNLGITITYDVSSHMDELNLDRSIGSSGNPGDGLNQLTYGYTNEFYALKKHSAYGGGYFYFYGAGSSGNYGECNILMRENRFVAFEVNIPVAGKYTMKVNHAYDNDGNIVNVYYMPSDEWADNITTTQIRALTEAGGYNCAGINDDYTVLTESTLKKTGSAKNELSENDAVISIEESGKYVFIFHSYYSGENTTKKGSVGSFSLVSGGSGNVIMGAEITEVSDALTVGGETAQITATGYLSTTAEKASFTYASNNTGVATVDAATGVVTPVGAGTAAITATCADATINNVLTTNVTVEADEIGEVIDGTVQVYIDALSGGTVTKSTASTIDNVAVGAKVEVMAVADEGYVFSHWQDSVGKFVSKEVKYSFNPYANTSVIAVFDKNTVSDGDTKTVYFYNGNGEYIDEKTTTTNEIEMPENASLAGYIFDMWTVDGINEFNGTNITTAVTRAVAKYEEDGKTYTGKVKFGTEEHNVVYDKALAFADESAKYWMRNGNIVDFGTTYNHYMFDAAEITIGTDDIDEVPVIVLDKHSSEDMYMIEYDLPKGYTKLEAGILFGDSTHNTVDRCYYKAKSANKAESAEHGQFTASPSADTSKTWNVVRGYLIYSDGTTNRVIYED